MFTSSLAVEFTCVINYNFNLNSTRLEIRESRSMQGRYENVTQNLTPWGSELRGSNRSETSVSTQRDIPEDSKLNEHGYEVLKSRN